MSGDDDVRVFATFSFAYAAANAVWPSSYGGKSATQVRFSGLSISTPLRFLVAGFASTIVTALGALQVDGWVAVSMFTAVFCLIATAAALQGSAGQRVDP
jgi:hypothetical protein